MEFTSKTQLQFEPGASPAMDMTALGEKYTTPEHFRDKLGDLSQLKYLSAEWACQIDASETSAAVVLVELMAGAGTVLASNEFTLDATSQGARQEVDLFNVGGAQRLWVRVTVNTVGTGTATVKSWLSIAQPLVVGGC